MNKIVPLCLLLLLFSGCAGNAATSPTPDISQTAAPQQVTLPSSSSSPIASDVPPTQKPTPNWHYELTRDGVFRTDQNTGEIVNINNSDYPTGIIITEDWVYYCDDNGQLYRMDNDNTEELLVDEKSWPLRVSGDVLYYLSSSGVNRMNLDGSGKEQVFDRDYTGIEMTDTYIFYTLSTPESEELNEQPGADDGPSYLGELHRVGLDGEGDVVVAELITDFSVYENLIYYADAEDNAFYSFNPETLEQTKIENVVMAEDMHFSNNYLFFMTHTDRCFYRMSLTDGTLTKLASNWPHCRGILDGYIYIDISGIGPEEDGLYRVKIDGVDLEKVADF